MPTPSESRAALEVLTSSAIGTSQDVFAGLNGSPVEQRAVLLEVVPEIVGYFSEGSAALAVDFYDERRELAAVTTAFVPQLVVTDRTVKLRRAVAWSTEPLFGGDEAASVLVAARLAEVIQLDVARPYRDTILTNRRQDPASVGWRRITRGGCRFCRMLADRGAIYRQATARFAAHPACHCTAEPVFNTNDTGEEASVMQYMASRHNRTPAQQAALRDYLDTFY
jgi:hypothetical protein